MINRNLELAAILERLDTLEQEVAHMYRLGTVTQRHLERGAVTVRFEDADEMEAHVLPVLFRRTMLDKEYDLPDIDEQVFCVRLPFGLEQGFVVGSPYSAADGVPVANGNKTHRKFKDGAVIEYDRDGHVYTISLPTGSKIAFSASTIDALASALNLGGLGGKEVARKGDAVQCACGVGHITGGSSTVKAVD